MGTREGTQQTGQHQTAGEHIDNGSGKQGTDEQVSRKNDDGAVNEHDETRSTMNVSHRVTPRSRRRSGTCEHHLVGSIGGHGFASCEVHLNDLFSIVA